MDYKFDEVITFAEASALWELSDGALRHMIKTPKLQQGIDYRKSGCVWLITKQVMTRLYGKIELINEHGKRGHHLRLKSR